MKSVENVFVFQEEKVFGADHSYMSFGDPLGVDEGFGNIKDFTTKCSLSQQKVYKTV